MEVASAFEVDVNLRYFAGRSANGSAQASHNIALLLLERHRGDTKVPEAVIVAVLEHVTLALAQLDAGADLSSARIIREGALTKILDMFPSRAALSTMETVRKRITERLEQSPSSEMKIGLLLACALSCYDTTTGTVPTARRSEALGQLRRALHLGQSQEGLSGFGQRLMKRIREEKAKLEPGSTT